MHLKGKSSISYPSSHFQNYHIIVQTFRTNITPPPPRSAPPPTPINPIIMDSLQCSPKTSCTFSAIYLYFYISKYMYLSTTGRGSSIGSDFSEFAWHASGPEFDPHVRHILSWRLGHENISTAILLLPLIQEEQLSVTAERMRTKYW